MSCPTVRSMKSRNGFNADAEESAKLRVPGRFQTGILTEARHVPRGKKFSRFLGTCLHVGDGEVVLVCARADAQRYKAAEGCGRLHVEAHRGVTLQVLVINLVQKYGE